MKIEVLYNIIAISCIITAVLTTIQMVMKAKKSSESEDFLQLRLQRIELELSCLKSQVRLNTPKFSDRVIESLEEFQKELREVKK